MSYGKESTTMNITLILKALANGVNPESGEMLPRSSVAHTPEAIRLLFALSEEFSGTQQGKKVKKEKLTPLERQQKNLAEGKPAKSYFPWSEEEKLMLEEYYKPGKSIEGLANDFDRSVRAVAIQLEKMGLITAEQLVSYT